MCFFLFAWIQGKLWASIKFFFFSLHLECRFLPFLLRLDSQSIWEISHRKWWYMQKQQGYRVVIQVCASATACMRSPFLCVCHPAEADHSSEHSLGLFNVALLLLMLRNGTYFASTVIPACKKIFRDILSSNDSQYIENPKWTLFQPLAFLEYYAHYSPQWPNIMSRKFKSAKPHHPIIFVVHSLRPTSRDLPVHKSVYFQFP